MYVLVYLCGLLLLGQLVVLLVVGLSHLSGFLVVVKVFYKGVVGGLIFVFCWVMCYGGFVGGVVSLGSGLWLGVSLDFLVDFYTICFYLVAGVVSWSILEFGFSYVGGEPQFGKFSWMLLCFLFFMMCLVVAGNFLMLFLGWEGVGLLSFVLISWWCSRESAVGSSIQAVLYNRVGDFGMMIWLSCLLFSGTGFSLGENEALTFGFFFLLLAIMAKSSQFLFHPWLPNAMEGPTPVSSLLHSSTMVVAGVFLLIRVVESVDCMGVVMLVGAVTSFWGGYCAIGQFDFKKVVAFSTTSQLGFMVFTVGMGFSYLAFFHVLMHAFFKAMIFMVSGEMIHARQNIQDLRELGHGMLYNKTSGFLLVLGSGVMMGFPFLSGFFTKDMVMEGFFGGFFNRWVFFLFLVSVLFTCGYSTWIIGKMLISWGWGCSVVLGLEGMLALFFLYRPYILAVCGGVLLWGFLGNFAESYVTCLVKVGPLIVFGLGTFCGVMLVLWRAQLVGGFAFYLGFFNPLVHKFVIYLGQIGAFFSLYCDYLVLELILPRGLVLVWSKVGTSLFVLLVSGCAICVWLWGF
uniref:NADH-ubiquinone oxidoreductase chain 5 n=1 Tax=Halocynthia aurantium TaxID=254849 RepID=A0A7L8Y3N1_HALAU|nr:NADH dehydrogenase subunit 5 [Halocynthia aurantium]QOI13838.1 NADH dehydrogenase subunit 5 [Halocynthia aurantium]